MYGKLPRSNRSLLDQPARIRSGGERDRDKHQSRIYVPLAHAEILRCSNSGDKKYAQNVLLNDHSRALPSTIVGTATAVQAHTLDW